MSVNPTNKLGIMIGSEEDKVVLKGANCTSVGKSSMMCAVFKIVETQIENINRRQILPQLVAAASAT